MSSSALAVLRLMVSSNFVGVCTGRSPSLLTVQDAISIPGRAAELIDDFPGLVRHQAAVLGELSRKSDGWDVVAGRGRYDRSVMDRNKRIVGHDQAASFPAEHGDFRFDLGVAVQGTTRSGSIASERAAASKEAMKNFP